MIAVVPLMKLDTQLPMKKLTQARQLWPTMISLVNFDRTKELYILVGVQIAFDIKLLMIEFN